MINRAAKGQRTERRAIEDLKKMGFTIAFRSVRTPYNAIDFDGVFDIVAYNSSIWRFVQVKCGYCPNKVRQEISDKRYPYGVHTEVWCWRKRKWHKERIIPGTRYVN